MKEFKPSRQFVSKVMREVRAYEAVQRSPVSAAPRFLPAALIRPALSVGGALFGIINIIRILFTVFSPALCR